jgi:hypothetical protein
MTQREKVLASALVGLLGFLGSGLVLFLFVVEPLREVRDRRNMALSSLEDKQNELNNEKAQIDEMFRVNPRLALWHELSLSPNDPTWKKGVPPTEEQKKKHLTLLQYEYEQYLNELLVKNGFRDILTTARPIEQRSSAPTQRGKKPLFERLAFNVIGRARLDDSVKMLKEFHQAPLLHQIRTLSADLVTTRGTPQAGAVAPGTLELKMTVEALVVAGARDRASLLPPKLTYKPVVLANPERDYALMGKKNMFVGLVRDRTGREDDKPTESKEDVLSYVKLTMLWREGDSERWQATFYDQAKGGSEIKVASSPSWRAKFKILDKYEETTLDAKVVYMDEKQLIFEADEKYYRMKIGDFIYPCMKKSLSKKELEEVGIVTRAEVSAARGDSSQ